MQQFGRVECRECFASFGPVDQWMPDGCMVPEMNLELGFPRRRRRRRDQRRIRSFLPCLEIFHLQRVRRPGKTYKTNTSLLNVSHLWDVPSSVDDVQSLSSSGFSPRWIAVRFEHGKVVAFAFAFAVVSFQVGQFARSTCFWHFGHSKHVWHWRAANREHHVLRRDTRQSWQSRRVRDHLKGEQIWSLESGVRLKD